MHKMLTKMLLFLQMDMGFPSNACQKALFFTKNSGLESATQWVMEHITDPDFSDPLVQPGKCFQATDINVGLNKEFRRSQNISDQIL